MARILLRLSPPASPLRSALMARLIALIVVACGVCACPPAAVAAPVELSAERPFPPQVRGLLKDLGDPDPATRLSAIGELRRLARRADVSGAQRVRRGVEFDPAVSGLVPHLVKAADDQVEANRVAALHALADTLDPVAVSAVRAALKDDSDQVRLTAACLLTEFQDASGLDVMKRALARFREKPDAAGPFEVERLLASFQRLTGKSFGKIPMNPILASDSRVAAASEKRYRELLDAWATWWTWEPGK